MRQQTLELTLSDELLREKFLTLKTIEDLVSLLEVDKGQLIYYLHKLPTSEKYTSFTIAKKNGDKRLINAPKSALKIIQRKLNQILQATYRCKPSVHGFVRAKSIVTNAKAHLGKRYILNIDLEDFFPSINFGRVRGMFMGKPYHIPEEVSTILAQICCHDNQLPQGAPTSPVISNMICARMDSELQNLANAKRCHYTRYGDDITFSTNSTRFPSGLAEINSLNQIEVGSELQQAIQHNGFKINNKKVRLQRRNINRQEVTGIIINEFPNVQRKLIRQIRAMLNAWEVYGYDNAETVHNVEFSRKHRNPDLSHPSFRSIVRGKIEYLGMVRGKQDMLYIKYLKKLQDLDPHFKTNLSFPMEPIDDDLTPYEKGLFAIERAINTRHRLYNEFLLFQARLFENISSCRKYGDNENLRSERNRIQAQLNPIAIEITGKPFVKLCHS